MYNRFSVSLDRYLTSAPEDPDDEYEPTAEEIREQMAEEDIAFSLREEYDLDLDLD